MAHFIHPCPNAVVTQGYGYVPFNGATRWHQGVDFAQNGNVPILASADGVVRDMWDPSVSTYGNVIFLQHTINGERMDTVYAHLKSFNVKKGDKVKQGQIIGYMGNTGNSTGQHLHFEIHYGPWLTGQPNAVDPLNLIGKTIPQKTSSTPAKTKAKQLVLPATASSWRVYPTNKAPVIGNEKGYLNPQKFGGLTYDILGNPQTDVYTIQTRDFGKVNIYAAKSTGAVIKTG